MKKKIKIISVISILIVIIIYGVYAYLQPMPVETKTISSRDLAVTFTELGLVVHSGEKIIYPLSPGEVTKVLVKEGESVKEGQVLAELSSDALDHQIQQAASMLEGYKAQLAGAETEYKARVQNLKASKAGLEGQIFALNSQAGTSEQKDLEVFLEEQSKLIYDQGLIDLEKNRELLESGIISQNEFIGFEQLVKSYEANYLQSQVSYTMSDESYKGSRNTLYAQISAINETLKLDTLSSTQAYYQSLIDGAQAAHDLLVSQKDSYNITSPISGIVNNVSIKNTNMVTGMEQAFIIQGKGQAHVEVKVSARDIGSVKIGDEVSLLLDQRVGDIELKGSVTYIASNAIVEISPLGIEERKVMVFIKPDNNFDIGPGYKLDTKFTVFSETNKLLVPNSALYKVDGLDTVMVIQEGKALEVPVSLGYELTGETLIEDGLEEGDTIIIDLDASGLVPGKNVKSSNE